VHSNVTNTPLCVRAFGKINLALYVLGKRPDGYHEISTVMQAVDLSDTLTFKRVASGLSFRSSDPALPSGEENLVVRAVRVLEQRMGRPFPLDIQLDKQIPVGAGMGGGSSDAACTLWAVNRLYDLGLDRDRLRSIAALLGSDVPFFLSSGQALATGRGEVLSELDLPTDYEVRIAFPGFPVSAAEAYARTKTSLTNPLADCSFRPRLSPEEFWAWIGSHDNDLACGVTATYPVVARGIGAMRSLGARHAGMTGSGSAVFGLFTRREAGGNPNSTWPLSGEWAVWSARPVKTQAGGLPAAGVVSPGGPTCGDHRGSNRVEE
jgi:4-diphosphocytidyl-2-C-methyl-D-erythritol kinase